MITLILADDHLLTRAGIRSILSKAADIQIVGEAQDSFEVKKLVEQHKPRVLLLDLIMPGPRPAIIEKWVWENYPETITLVLTAHNRDIYLASMVDTGKSGYITNDQSEECLINAIHRAAQGGKLLTEEQYARVFNWNQSVRNKWESLTGREHEVFQLIMQGTDNATVAAKLNIAPKTIACHVTSILEKVGARSRQEAIIWAQ